MSSSICFSNVFVNVGSLFRACYQWLNNISQTWLEIKTEECTIKWMYFRQICYKIDLLSNSTWLFRSYFKVISERGHSSLSWDVLVCFTTDPCSEMCRKITLIFGRNCPNVILNYLLFIAYTSLIHNAACMSFWSYTEANCIYLIEFI